MSKFRLEIEYDYEFLLFGISCHLKDYRLCWYINKAFDLDLKKSENLELERGNEDLIISFSFYEWPDERNRLQYKLVANRGDVGYLLQEYKQVDYFLIIEGYTDMLDKEEIVARLKQIQAVLAAFEVEPKALKSRQNLLFD